MTPGGRSTVRIVAPILLVMVGIACVASGLRVDAPEAGTAASVRDGDVAIQRSYRARARLHPKGGFRITGTVGVEPDAADAQKSVVTIELTNPYPEVARMHATVRDIACNNLTWGRDGRQAWQLEPVDDGESSVTTLDTPVSTLTTTGLTVALVATDDVTVYACATLLPRDPVLAASTQSVTAFDRSCDAYLTSLSEDDLADLDPQDLPAGRCRDQARDAIARSDRRTLDATAYPSGQAEGALNALRDCLVAAGLDLPPVELDERGTVSLLTGLARRDRRWSAASARCDRAHPLPHAARSGTTA